MLEFPLFKKKKKYFLVLDIGTEAVKSLVFEKEKEKISILGVSLQYFDIRNFGRDIVDKTISKAVEEAQKQAGKKTNFTLIGLPANILKGRVVSQNLKRKERKKIINEKEEKLIYQRALEGAKKKISQIYSQESGILPQDIQFINLKILEIKIDGYPVPALQGYEGRNLDFRILATFSAGDRLKEIENICQAMDFKQKKIFHEVEGLMRCFREVPEGIFLDVGGEISQISLVKEGRLENIDEFELGGEIFSRAISEKLGLREQDSRIFKERYSKKELSKESSERIKEIFWLPAHVWFKNLKLKLKKMSSDGLLPQDIILFGGGSQLPEIKEILKTGNWEALSFSAKPNIKIVQPADFRNFEIKTGELNSPQNIPALLICRVSQIGEGSGRVASD